MSAKTVYLLEQPGRGNLVVRDVAERLFREKILILSLLVGWTGFIGAYLWLTPATYQEEIRFVLNNNRPPAVVSAEMSTGPVSRDYVDEAAIATEIQLLSSGDLLRKVAETAGLADKKDRVATAEAIQELRKTVKVAPVLKANMIKATYSSSNPKTVESVLKALADGYLEEHLRAHSTSGSFQVFDEQATFYQQRLKELQERLSTFHQERNIVALAQQKDLGLRKLEDFQAARNENDAARRANARRLAQLRQQISQMGARITTQARVVPNQYSVERLNTMLVELQNKRTEMAAKYQPGDRLIRELDQQISDTRKALATANGQIAKEETTDVNPLRQSLEAELAKAELAETEYRSRGASLAEALANYRQSLSGLESATNDDDQLLRQIKEAEESYFLYSKKREEARIEQAMDRQKVSNVALVQEARLPVLPVPKLSVTLAASWVLGCCLILGGGLMKTVLRNTVHTPWEVEGLTGLPVLASVPVKVLTGEPRALGPISVPESKA
jgi:uncharacterized protein involved in exopolysaccharide biosynthesis